MSTLNNTSVRLSPVAVKYKLNQCDAILFRRTDIRNLVGIVGGKIASNQDMELSKESTVGVNKVTATTKNKKAKKRPVNRNDNLHLVCCFTNFLI